MIINHSPKGCGLSGCLAWSLSLQSYISLTGVKLRITTANSKHSTEHSRWHADFLISGGTKQISLVFHPQKLLQTLSCWTDSPHGRCPPRPRLHLSFALLQPASLTPYSLSRPIPTRAPLSAPCHPSLHPSLSQTWAG